MDNFRRPAVGIPGVLGNAGGGGASASGGSSGRPGFPLGPGAGGSGAASAGGITSPVGGRDAAKINMLRRMRPPPFQYAWTLYHDKHAEGDSYDHRQTVLLENIITIKVFWEAYNSFPLRALAMKDSVHFFKRGVKPVWEDRRNVTGGSWTFRVTKDKSEPTWKELLMLAVGEQFADVIQPRDDICGLTLSTRFNSDLIQIWTRDGNNTLTVNGILKTVFDKLSPELKPKEGSYYYKKHSEHNGFAEAVSKANIKLPSRMQEFKPDQQQGGAAAAADGDDGDLEPLGKIKEAEVQPDEAEAQQQKEDEEIIAQTPGLKEQFGFD